MEQCFNEWILVLLVSFMRAWEGAHVKNLFWNLLSTVTFQKFRETPQDTFKIQSNTITYNHCLGQIHMSLVKCLYFLMHFVFKGDTSERRGKGDWKHALVIVVLRVSRVKAGGEGLLLLWREWKLSHSQIPSYQCGHGGSTLISSFSQPISKSLLSCSATSKLFPPFEYLCGLFSHNSPQIWLWQRFPDLWMCTLMAFWSDKASVLTCHLWEVPLFVCLQHGVVV